MPAIRLRHALACAALACTASAQAGTAAPANLYASWWAPQAQQALHSAQALQQSLQQYCAADAAHAPAALHTARSHWQQAVQDWQRLSAVAIGPMVQRRSARVVDFQPLRPAQLQAAIAQAASSAADMERIGGPAKGWPALEHLLWTQPAAPASAPCHYASLAAADAAQELGALQRELHQQATQGTADFFLLEEFLNQWVGGVERLRWAAMDKPLRSARPGKAPALPRAVPAHNVASWQAHWDGLRTLAVGAPQYQGQHLAQLVDARGWSHLAQRLRTATDHVHQQLGAITQPELAQVQGAVQALAALKHLVETEVAPALDVTIGFSDADGD